MSRKYQKLNDNDTNSEPNEGRLRLELRKLTNTEGWVSTPRESSCNSSRASTPVSHDTSVPRRGRPPKKLALAKKYGSKNNNFSEKSKSVQKPKKFKMVLEKDDVYEVDYLTPDEADSTTSSVEKGDFSDGSISDNSYYLDEDVSSVEEPSSPLWMDEDEEEDEVVAPLNLPASSEDLLISNEHILEALAVYEVLRHFRNTLRLSPFLFEDFCAALAADETSVLMNECHITLLKMLLKEEENVAAMFVPLDQKDAYNASFHFIDYLTWPEVLRAYLESSPQYSSVVPILEDTHYPNVEVPKKIKVLKVLTNLFLSTSKIRDELMMDGMIRYDDHCRSCHRLGDLLCCETCPAVYHLACCNPPLKEVPEDEWQCEICVAHKLNGVSDCESESEMAGQYLRHDPVGMDRHGRKYWFLVRRLFVEAPGDVRYYTTYEEFKHVLSKLDHERYEMVLCEALKDVLEEFPRQSKITEELTNESRWKDEGKTRIELMKEKTKALIEEEKNEEKRIAEESRIAEEKRIAEQQRIAKEKRIAEENRIAEEKRIAEDNRIAEDKRIAEEKQITEEKDTDKEVASKEAVMDVGQYTIETIRVSDTGHFTSQNKDSEDTKDSIMEVTELGAQECASYDDVIPMEVKTEAPDQSVAVSTTEIKPCTSFIAEMTNETECKKADDNQSSTAKDPEESQNVTGRSTPTAATETAVSVSQSIPTTSQQTASSSSSVAANQSNVPLLPKNTLIPLSLKVPLTRCDALLNSNNLNKPQSSNPVFKVGQKVQLKSGATAAPLANIKHLYVLSKDGVRTPLTIDSGGKLVAGSNQKLIMINPGQQQNKVPSQPQTKLSRELRRLQFAGAGPKMQKMVTLPGMKVQPSNNTDPSPMQSSTTGNQDINSLTGAAPSAATQPTVTKPPKDPFRLGEDDGYKQYKNYFVENTLALNKYQHKEEKDKDRHVGYKFSMGGPVEFEWPGSLCGTRAEIVHTLRSALFLLEQEMPLCFMHSKWEQYRKMWGHMLIKNDSTKAFAVVLGILEMAIRNNAKRTVWREGFGQVRMRRLTMTEKELYEKKKKHKIKVEEDVANRNAVWCKYPLPVKSNLVLKIRGEEYRLTGYGGWMWYSSTYRSRERKPEAKSTTFFKSVIKETTKPSPSSKEDNTETKDTESISSESSYNADALAKETQTLVSACDVINVSKHLLVRSVVYNKRWSSSKVDKLLRWRILQEKERLKKIAKKSENIKGSTNENSTLSTSNKSDNPLAEKTDTVSSSTNVPTGSKITRNENDVGEETSVLLSEKNVLTTTVNTSSGRGQTREVIAENEEATSLDEPEISDEDNVSSGRIGEDVDVATSDTKQVIQDEEKSIQKREETRSNKDSPNMNTSELEVKKSPASDEKMEIETNTSSPTDKFDVNALEVADNTNPQTSGDVDEAKRSDVAFGSGRIDNVLTNTSNEAEKVSTSDDVIASITPVSNKKDHKKVDSDSPVSGVDSPCNMDIDVSAEAPRKVTTSTENIVCNGDVCVGTVLEKVVSTTTTEEAVTSLTSHVDRSDMTTITTTTIQTTTTTVSSTTSTSVGATNTVQETKLSEDVDITDNVTSTLNPTNSKAFSIDTASDKLETRSFDSVSKSSTVEIDRADGVITSTSSTYKISRRFRNDRRNGVSRSSMSSTKVQSSQAKTWKLVKSPADSSKKSIGEVKMPLPWKFSTGKEKRKSIFRLPRSCVKYMATRGGLAWYPLGFRHVQKSPTSLELFWPYRCVRPTIGTAWRYKLQNATTLANIAHLLRVLWHSIRWDDIVTRPSTDDVIHTVHNEDDIVSIELLKRKNIGVSGLRSEYFVRRIVMPTADYDEEIPRSETYTPSSRSGLRTRGRQMSLRERTKKESTVVEPKVETLWLPEDKIQLWQIRQFDTMIRSQQKAAAKKEAEATKAKTVVPSPLPMKKQLSIREALNNLNAEKPTPSPATAAKHVTISPALLQQATALHRSQGTYGANVAVSKIISVNTAPQKVLTSGTFPIKLSEGSTASTPGHFQTITLKSPNVSSPQFVSLKPGAPGTTPTPSPAAAGTILQTSGGQTFYRAAPAANQFVVQGSRVLPRKILVKSGAITSTVSDQAGKNRHPTIKLGGPITQSKLIQQPVQTVLLPQPAAAQPVVAQPIPPPAAPAQQPSSQAVPPKPGTSMQVKLSASQLGELMKVGMGSVVKVHVTLADGKPGMGQLQMILPGSQVTPAQGQQLMQCKVGNDVRRFLLTALSEDGKTTTHLPAEQLAADNEVTLKTPSLRHRLEQLQHRTQELMKQPGTNNIHRLMTDKDPLWGGRTSQPTDKPQLGEKSTKKDTIEKPTKKRVYHGSESREERQRKNVVQQVLKSMLDRIERKEELEARRKKKEEKEEMLKKKKESMDVLRSQQRLHHRLLHALIRHEEHIKQEIRKRRTITEKYLTKIVENELYEDRLKMRRRKNLPAFIDTPVAKQPKKSNYMTTSSAISSILTENNKKSPQKKNQQQRSARKRSHTQEEEDEISENPAKKKKMINRSTQLYCICNTPYDDARFYIGCDLCMNWFHGSCVGISERKAKSMETWVCNDCDKEQSTPQQELYCLCKTPYDDTQFYIGCDVCQDWYHGHCVGISQDAASSIDSYTCPKCKNEARDASFEETLSGKEISDLTKIIKHLQNHKMAWPFLEPVREADAPGYYKVVKRPMDLQTVLKRLSCRYYLKLSELVGDVSLIFDNCRQYNGADSKIVRCAEIVETVFVGRIRDMRGR